MRPPQSTMRLAGEDPPVVCTNSSTWATERRYDGSAMATSYQTTTMLAFTAAIVETSRARITVRISSTTTATLARSPAWS